MVPLLDGATAVELPQWLVRVDDGLTEIAAPIAH
jgi:hypothetical protein